MSRIFNNTTDRVVDDLKTVIHTDDKITIASACFSIYAFQALKDQLKGLEELRFLFTSPTFAVPEKTKKESREYFIPQRGREQSLYGTDFEVRLRNELTQKAIARECADWIREKVKFRTNLTDGTVTPFLAVNDKASYAPIMEFTAVGLGVDRGNTMTNFVFKQDASEARQLLASFEPIWNDPKRVKDVTAEVLDSITAAYKENAPELVYYLALCSIFNEFLGDLNTDSLPDEAVGFKQTKIWNVLYDFQKDAALSIINKLERFNGCILADSVGLGKTFTALAVIKYYEKRNKNVLILCPKKLTNNWTTYRANYKNNPLVEDRFSYTVLYHTDLSRTSGTSNGVDLKLVNWENFDLVVIDESHNFRNGGHEELDDDGNVIKQNRYSRLMEEVIKKGVKTKVLMLSATPVNNRFTDLRNQLELAYEGNEDEINEKLQTANGVSEVFRLAQAQFSEWSRLPSQERTVPELLKRLSVDFFTVLDAVTIARSRKHIRSYYNMDAIGKFPERLSPRVLQPELTDLSWAPTYDQIYASLEKLNLLAYMPSAFIHPSRRKNYLGQKGFQVDFDFFDGLEDVLEDGPVNLTQEGREAGIRKLMGINLLKRLESSVYAFCETIDAVLGYMRAVISRIDDYERSLKAGTEPDDPYVGRKIRIRLEDMDYLSYRTQVQLDESALSELKAQLKVITPEHDLKLKALVALVDEKLNSPINAGNRKILIFSAFSDTALYLYRSLSSVLLENYNLNSAVVTGDADGVRSTLKDAENDFNDVLTLFSPRSKEKKLLFSGRRDPGEIDILFATDCISEGQNLQDCDMVVNYDIHWNPCRIIQRYGRVDRIGSMNDRIQLVNFWPNVSLDRYINVRDRVEARMKIVNISATGDDNPIAEDDPELEFRRRQLERLKNEAVDLEDMNEGISIMDLGLNEFQQDLLAYVRANPGRLDRLPHGISAVTRTANGLPPGIIFVLRNVNEGVNVEKQNRLHPYYLVYIGEDGQIAARHTNPKGVLDDFRLLCKGKDVFDKDLTAAYNRETKNGKDMRKASELLGQAIASLIERQGEGDVDSLFSGGETTTALENKIEGLDDFELVTFLVVRGR